jgi:hypothetical protein
VNSGVIAFAALFSGMVGWWFTNFIFHPWKEVQTLRRKARFETIYWNHSPMQTKEQRETAYAAFRKVALEFVALNETSPLWFVKLLKFYSYDLKAAADGLICLSHATMGEIDVPHIAICRHHIEKALALQLEFSDEDYERIRERWRLLDRNSWYDDDDFASDPVEDLFQGSS